MGDEKGNNFLNLFDPQKSLGNWIGDYSCRMHRGKKSPMLLSFVFFPSPLYQTHTKNDNLSFGMILVACVFVF